MKGFTDKALLILPKAINLDQRDYKYREMFQYSIDSMVKVFKECFDIDIYCLRCNCINSINLSNCNIICDFPKADTLFLDRVCNSYTEYSEDFEEIKQQVLEKWPNKRGMPDEERLKLIEKRQREIGRRIANEFSLVIDMEKNADKYYSIKPKDNSSRIIVDVDFNTFSIKTFMGENQYPPVTLFNEPWAVLPVYRWEESLCQS